MQKAAFLTTRLKYQKICSKYDAYKYHLLSLMIIKVIEGYWQMRFDLICTSFGLVYFLFIVSFRLFFPKAHHPSKTYKEILTFIIEKLYFDHGTAFAVTN